jgi:anti-sigma B factor antagonist
MGSAVEATEPTPTGLKIRMSSDSDQVVLFLSGEIDAGNARDLVEPLMMVPDDCDVTIDLTDVEFMDSSGLTALLSCQARLLERHIVLTVRNPCQRVRRLFDVCGVADELL